MKLPFTKMHGLGNDFVIIDALQSPIELNAKQIRFIADRRFGIGCDQVLIIAGSQSPWVDVRYRIFNADGNEVEQCGNGLRCIGEYLRRRSLVERNIITIETISGLVRIYLEDNEQIRVDMGVPSFAPEAIPLATEERKALYPIALATGEVEAMVVSMGNPHAVLTVEDVDRAPVSTLGPAIQQSPLFPEGVNVGFMQILDPAHIRLRVYERGAGETLACGTGACGAVVTGINAGKLAAGVDVELQGGSLSIKWAGEGQSVWMSGPATTVYEGQIEI